MNEPMAWATKVPSYSTIRGCLPCSCVQLGQHPAALLRGDPWTPFATLRKVVGAVSHQSRYQSSGAVVRPDHQDVRELDGVSVSTHGARQRPLIHAATPLKLAKIATQ